MAESRKDLQIRLQKLYEADQKVGYALLGTDKRAYRKLMNQRYKIRNEIHRILKDLDKIKEEFYEKIRLEMERVGFEPTTEEGKEAFEKARRRREAREHQESNNG